MHCQFLFYVSCLNKTVVCLSLKTKRKTPCLNSIILLHLLHYLGKISQWSHIWFLFYAFPIAVLKWSFFSLVLFLHTLLNLPFLVANDFHISTIKLSTGVLTLLICQQKDDRMNEMITFRLEKYILCLIYEPILSSVLHWLLFSGLGIVPSHSSLWDLYFSLWPLFFLFILPSWMNSISLISFNLVLSAGFQPLYSKFS